MKNKLKSQLKSYVPTRLNTVCDMLDSLIRNFDDVEKVLREQRESHRLNDVIILDVEDIFKLLKPFREWSNRTETSKTPSLHYVLPALKSIQSMLQPSSFDTDIISEMKKIGIKYLEERFKLHDYHFMASFLNPNMKSLRFASEDEKNKVKVVLKRMLDEIPTEENNENHNTRANPSSSSLSLYYDDESSERDEFENYRSARINISDDIDISEWWFAHRKTYPKLTKVALFIHSIQASSTSSERLFSLSGNIISDKRSNLDPDTIEDLVIAHKHFE